MEDPPGGGEMVMAMPIKDGRSEEGEASSAMHPLDAFTSIKRISPVQGCFVFVKHPFDVGDRVTIYGNTGKDMKGDDYFVKEIALLYTKFKKMEGHVVQAPNSYLNTLFILNQRRSGGLAEAVPITVKFGTTLEQIDALRTSLLEFVESEKREYQKNILTELREVFEAHSITLNVVFFYKSNWQNELLRLQRRNKFICALMVSMNELGIEGPRMRLAGANPQFPMHLYNAHTGANSTFPTYQTPSPPPGQENIVPDPNFQSSSGDYPAHGSILRKATGGDHRGGRRHGESIGAMGKRVDFSLGLSSISSGDQFGDVFDDPKPKVPHPGIRKTSPSPRTSQSRASEDSTSLAQTTSRDSAGGSRTHRNRFFSRSKSRVIHEEDGDGRDEVSLEDLEAGTAARDGHRKFSVYDMPDIPEASGARLASVPVHGTPSEMGSVSRVGTGSGGRIDPRTGIISSQAVA